MRTRCYAFDAATGKEAWHFIAGARMDSPPTYWKGRVIFGWQGWLASIACAPATARWSGVSRPRRATLRHGAFEQMESVWPVHGSVLGGKRRGQLRRRPLLLPRRRPAVLPPRRRTGKKLVEVVYDDKDPETGGDFKDRHKTLQMPDGLNDILTSDGKGRSTCARRKSTPNGKRIDIGPVSGNVAEQARAQKGEGRTSFAPMGYPRRLDGSTAATGSMARAFLPAATAAISRPASTRPTGRILVLDDKNVYGYGREAEVLQMDHDDGAHASLHEQDAAGREASTCSAEGGEKEGQGRCKSRRPQRRCHIPGCRQPRSLEQAAHGRMLGAARQGRRRHHQSWRDADGLRAVA